MRKVLSLCTLFIVTMAISVQVRNRERENDTEEFNEGRKIDSEKDVEGEEGEHEDGPQEFLKYHRGIRTRANEEKPGYAVNYQWTELTKARKTAAARRSAKSSRIQSNGVTTYTERGPGNVPGRTRGLIVDPDDATNKTWYAGSASGGIWKTIDAGTSWQWLTPSIPNLATTTLAMAESDHNTIYAGTGEGFGLLDGVDGQGIFKSIDRGATWNLLNSTALFGSVNRLAVDPSDKNTVLVATNNGIYRSTDGGTTWTQVYNGLVQDLRATPGNFSTLYGGEYGVGVIKSTDGGVTWATSNKAMAPNGRVEIAISPVNPNRIVASAEGTLSGNNSDVYLSDDGGATWFLVTLTLTSKSVDYLGSQGWYDNTVAFSPYDQNVVYVGGVSAFQITIGSSSTQSAGAYGLALNGTSSFLSLINFSGGVGGGDVSLGTSANKHTIQIKFGPGLSQMAYCFWVPVNATTGVANANYSYQGYVSVPFQVWDVTANQQLMVSFRDQNRNNTFDLIASNTTSSDATAQSREYIFVNNVPYTTTPNPSIATSGGMAFDEYFMIWPVLASNATWSPGALPTSNIQISYNQITKYSSTVLSVADVYGAYDGKNNRYVVHPDQHNIFPIKVSDTDRTYQLLMSNDGGVYLTGVSTSPGTTQGDWRKVGNGYNTSQFYGADKKPGAQEYLGGMQDNSVYFTPSGTVASSTTFYNTNSNLAGDGFEALWHTRNSKKMIGSNQYNAFVRSLDGGNTWTDATSGLSSTTSNYPFLSKLACSKQMPDVLYTVGSEGVWKSTDFAATWKVTSITTGWGDPTYLDVEVSRANANIVWAGSGMSTTLNLYVSTDAGQTFSAVPTPANFELGIITHIATHPTDEKTAYAIFSFAGSPKILMTTNLGQSWTDITGFGSGAPSTNNFPDVATYSLYVRPDNTNIIWAGTEIGIVESLDGGASWNLLTDFPSVAVWQMMGQDNEIVIATHGRGIWTAEVATDQNANFPAPTIMTWGTSPEATFVVQTKFPYQYDSVMFLVNSSATKYYPADTGAFNITLPAPVGTNSLQIIAYKGDAPIATDLYSAVNLQLTAPKQEFFDYFNNVDSLYTNGFSILSFGLANTSLQSTHYYPAASDETAVVRVPITVGQAGSATFIYQDVAIVQPGSAGSAFGQSAFNDFVVAEGTKDGITWIPIANGYNASSNSTWLSTFNAAQAGTYSMTVDHNFNLLDHFQTGDLILVRFRLHANADAITGWGWSIDNLYIQVQPAATEPTARQSVVFPNPTTGTVNMSFTMAKEGSANIVVWDATGRRVAVDNLTGLTEGPHQTDINLGSLPDGVYLLHITTDAEDKTHKIILRK